MLNGDASGLAVMVKSLLSLILAWIAKTAGSAPCLNLGMVRNPLIDEPTIAFWRKVNENSVSSATKFPNLRYSVQLLSGLIVPETSPVPMSKFSAKIPALVWLVSSDPKRMNSIIACSTYKPTKSSGYPASLASGILRVV